MVAGELSDALLDQLSALSAEVFLPLLAGGNLPMQGGGALPEVVARSVAESMHKFVASGKGWGGKRGVEELQANGAGAEWRRCLASAHTSTLCPHCFPCWPLSPTVQVSAGQMRNQTVLPLPPLSEAELGSGGPPGKEALVLLEAAVATWTRQIKGVLALDPEAAAGEAGGAAAGPLAELDYWADRAAQLNGIWEQLGRPRVHGVVTALAAAGSTYREPFEQLCREVDAARGVASENARFLKPLRKPLEKLHTMDDFPALAGLFKPILHTLLLIWQHAQHYSSAPRLVALVRQICNDLIAQARRFCPGALGRQGAGRGSGCLVFGEEHLQNLM